MAVAPLSVRVSQPQEPQPKRLKDGVVEWQISQWRSGQYKNQMIGPPECHVKKRILDHRKVADRNVKRPLTTCTSTPGHLYAIFEDLQQWLTDVGYLHHHRIHISTDRTLVNDARAMRVAEIMNDYRAIQLRISQYHVTPSASEYHEVGFGILRQCHAEAQAVLSIHFDPGALQAPTNSGEQTKRQLQR